MTGPGGITVEEVVTGWVDGRSLTFEIPRGMVWVVRTMRETWSVEAVADGAAVTVVMHYRTRLGPLGAALARLLVVPVLTRALEDNLAGLKRHVEMGRGGS